MATCFADGIFYVKRDSPVVDRAPLSFDNILPSALHRHPECLIIFQPSALNPDQRSVARSFYAESLPHCQVDVVELEPAAETLAVCRLLISTSSHGMGSTGSIKT